MRRSFIALGCTVLLAAGSVSSAPFSDTAVKAAIDKAIQFLWRTQQGNGSWGVYQKPGDKNFQYSGPTALAAYALLESGVDPKNEPRMARAMKYLADYKGEDRTYSLGLRCVMWEVANRKAPGEFRRLLGTDARKLWLAGGRSGNYDYKALPNQKRWDNSNSQYGLLGVWAAAMANIEVPGAYWHAVMRHWHGCQNQDGGWGYQANNPSTAAMVTAGVASLFVCYDEAYADRFVRCSGTVDLFRRVQRGIEWLDKHYARTLRGQGLGHSDRYYYLYGVERVGLASGRKYFGTVDWYKEGASYLLRTQGADGGWKGKWGKPVATSFALVFLVRGRNAVIFNKLEFDGDWNNRPRDVANATKWMSRTFERTVNWQIINVKVPVAEWHDAPILYISGYQKPNFTDEQISKLRTFVLQGGAIFSACECGGTAGFKKGIRDVYAKLFPEYKLIECGQGHPIYTKAVHFDLPGRPKFYEISNGVRPLVVHTDVDVPLSWQTRRSTTHRWAFQAAANVVRYVTDRVSLVRPRGTTHWPPPYKGSLRQTVKLARLKHAGAFDPEPLAYERFTRLMAHRTGTKVEVIGPIPISALAGSGAKVAALTGTGPLELPEADQAALKAFVDGGGLLVIDAAGGSRAFADTAEQLLRKLYGSFRLRKLASSGGLYRLKGMEIDKVKYRRRTQMRLGRKAPPNLMGVLAGRRIGVVFSREDLTAGLVGYPSWTIDGYAPESAFELMRNIVLSAL